MKSLEKAVVALVFGAVVSFSATAQQWSVAKPSNSGVPGEEIRGVHWSPDGDLWVIARWPFWGEAGIAVYDAPNDTFSVWSNWETALPSPYINEVEWTPDGIAWIATNGGLVRFDGTTFTVFDSSNSPLAFDKVPNISVAPNGHVWVNNSDFNLGGDAIYDFDGVSSWTRHAVPDELPWAAPWTDLSNVFVTSDGRVWVANNTLNGVSVWDGVEWSLKGDGVTRFAGMAEDQFGKLWLMANGVGGAAAFYRYDEPGFTTYPLASPTVLASDPDTGTIYAGNWFGTVMRTEDGGQTMQTYLTGLSQVFEIAPDPAGTDVWVGTIGAVGHFLGDGTWVKDFNSYNTGMPWYFVDYFDTDPSGNFWVATSESGLSRFDGRRWRNWGNHNVGSEPYPFAGNEPMAGVFQDSSGAFWFGGNGIARWDEPTGTFTGFWNWQNNPGMGVTMFPFFAEDAAGNVFASTENGTVYRFDSQASLWIKEPIQAYAVLGLPRMTSDSQGDVWLCAWFDLHHWDGTAWSQIVLPDPNYFFDLGGINEMAIGPDDVFWFGTVQGLVRWDGTTFTLFDTSNSPLHANLVTGLDVRSDGLIGVAARGGGASVPSGVAVIDGDPSDPTAWTTHLYGVAPIPHWQLDRLAFDGQGDLWVSAISEGAAVLHTGVWSDLGQSLAGTDGDPWLLGSGSLGADTEVALQLRDARPGSVAGLVLGNVAIGAPFKGGTLVPTPLVVLTGVPTGSTGDVLVSSTWPGGIPNGFSLYAQWWIADPAAPAGWAASNAVVGVVP